MEIVSVIREFIKADALLRLGFLEFTHQVLVVDIVDKVINDTNIMNTYWFIVKQEKVQLCKTEMTKTATSLLKQVTVAEKEVDTCVEEEPLISNSETGEQQSDKVLTTGVTKME